MTTYFLFSPRLWPGVGGVILNPRLHSEDCALRGVLWWRLHVSDLLYRRSGWTAENYKQLQVLPYHKIGSKDCELPRRYVLRLKGAMIHEYIIYIYIYIYIYTIRCENRPGIGMIDRFIFAVRPLL